MCVYLRPVERTEKSKDSDISSCVNGQVINTSTVREKYVDKQAFRNVDHNKRRNTATIDTVGYDRAFIQLLCTTLIDEHKFAIFPKEPMLNAANSYFRAVVTTVNIFGNSYLRYNDTEKTHSILSSRQGRTVQIQQTIQHRIT